MEKIRTPYGDIEAYADVRFYPDGRPELVVPSGRAVLKTPLGELVPQFTSDDMRRPKVEHVSFFPNGVLRSLSLEEPAVVPTPVGPLSVELVNFHPTGALRRAFPVNGKLSAYWSAANEKTLNAPITLTTPLGPVTATFIGLHFYESGALRSLTLWPGETLEVQSPQGPARTRIGLAFHKSGALRSMEPQEGFKVMTPVGEIEAYDPDPEGVCGDENSLVFDEKGQVSALATASDGLEVVCGENAVLFQAHAARNACEEDALDLRPLRLAFQPGAVHITTDGGRKRVNLDACRVTVKAGMTKPRPVLFGCGT